MLKLDKAGVAFFKKDLLDETNRQLMMFEQTASPEISAREFGRLRLYDDRRKIEAHFLISKTDPAGYEDNHPYHGLIAPLGTRDGSSCLIWKELEGHRHSITNRIEEDLVWENEKAPEARLTLRGEFTKKKRHETLS